MWPIPDKIIRCPKCGKHLKVRQYTLGNSCFVRHWSDSKTDYPINYNQPLIAHCPHCQVLFWVSDAPFKGYDLVSNPSHRKWKECLYIAPPGFFDYSDALETPAFSPIEYQYLLRKHLMVSYNNYIRHGRNDSITPLMHVIQRENLKSLIHIIKTGLPQANIYDKCILVEATRCLGRFEEAETELQKIQYPPFDWILKQFKQAVERRKSIVIEIYPPWKDT